MSYEIDTEFSDRKNTEKKLQDIQDQIYEIESFPTENVTSTGPNLIGKIRTKDNTQGGGASFPFDYPDEQRGPVGNSTEIIDFEQSNRHAVIMELVGDIGLSLINTTNGTLQATAIKLKQDGTGGHAFTGFSQTVRNEQAIIDAVNAANGPGEFVVFIVRRIDGLFTAFLEDNNIIGSGSADLPVVDTTSIVKGSVDDTKQMRFEVDGFSPSTIRVMTPPDANALLAGLNLAQSWTALNTFTGGIQISDSTPNVHGVLQGIVATGVRLTLTAGEKLQIFDNITPILEINQTSGLNMLSHKITNTLFIESDTANRPGSGFVRMAATDQLRWKNVLNTDDLYINVERPTLDSVTQDAFAFTVASGVRMYIGQFDISVEQNDIVNTGDVLPSGVGGNVGDSTNFYNQMHSQFFVPEPAAVIINRYGFAKTGNTLYVNFDDTNVDAGFGIFEQGVQRFLFSRSGFTPFTNVFHIGNPTSLAGEEYQIIMGQTASTFAIINYIDGVGNDLNIRLSLPGSDQGINIGDGARFLFDRTEFSKTLDINAQEITNAVNIKSNGGGGATTGTIGELITANGGFNYFIRSTLAWESNIDTKLTFGSNGITIETNSSNTDIAILAQGTNSDIEIRAATGGFLSLGRSGINHLQFAAGISTFSNANIILASGAQEIQFLDAIANASVATPAALDITLFNDLTTGQMSVKKDDGSTVSLEGSGANTALSNLTSPTALNQTLLPDTNNLYSLGSSLLQFRDLHIDNIANIDSLALSAGATITQFDTDDTLAADSDTRVPTQQAVKAYVDNASSDGIQDVVLSLDHETSEYDFEIWLSNAKQGNQDFNDTTPFYGVVLSNTQYFLPVYIGKRSNIIRIGFDIDFLDVGASAFAIYSNNGDQNYPGERLGGVVLGTLNTTGIFNVFFSQNVEPGLYWISFWIGTDGQNTTILYHTGQNANCVGWFPANGDDGAMAPILGFLEGQPNSTLPLFPEDDMVALEAEAVPAIFCKMVPST